MNSVVLIGRLTKEPNVFATTTGTKIARYTLAVDRRGGDETDFIDCVTFNKSADFAEKYLRKGTMIAVNGSIETGSYEKDGRRIYTTTVVVNNHEFVGKRQDAPPAIDAPHFESVPKNVDMELPFI